MKELALLALLGAGAFALMGGLPGGDDAGTGSQTPQATRRVGTIVNPSQPSTVYNFPADPALPMMSLKSPGQAFSAVPQFDTSAWDARNDDATKKESSGGGSSGGSGIYAGTRGPIDFSITRKTASTSSSALPSYIKKSGGLPVPSGVVGPRAPSPGPYLRASAPKTTPALTYSQKLASKGYPSPIVSFSKSISAIRGWF